MICSAMGVGCIIVWAISSFIIMKVFGLMWVIGGALTRGGVYNFQEKGRYHFNGS